MKAHLNDKFNDGMMAFLGKDYSTCIESLSEVLREDNTHKLALVSRGGRVSAYRSDQDGPYGFRSGPCRR